MKYSRILIWPIKIPLCSNPPSPWWSSASGTTSRMNINVSNHFSNRGFPIDDYFQMTMIASCQFIAIFLVLWLRKFMRLAPISKSNIQSAWPDFRWNFAPKMSKSWTNILLILNSPSNVCFSFQPINVVFKASCKTH